MPYSADNPDSPAAHTSQTDSSVAHTSQTDSSRAHGQGHLYLDAAMRNNQPGDAHVDVRSTSSTAPRTTPEPARTSGLRTELLNALSDCIVIDLETTGLDPQGCRIIEIAALRVVGSEVKEQFTTLLNPQQPVPEEITDLTGISDGLLQDKPAFADVLPELLRFLRPSSRTTQGSFETAPTLRLVGHNVSFDFSFLQHEIVRAQLATVDTESDAGQPSFAPYTPPLVCTAEASRELIPRQAVGRYRLANVAAYLNTPHRPLHRALSDAQTTYEVLRELAAL